MKHFISVIFKNQLTESKRDIVLDTITNTAKVGLLNSKSNYQIFESENNTSVLRIPLKTSVPEKLQKKFVETLANQLFDKGHTNFEIELSVINEAPTAAPTQQNNITVDQSEYIAASVDPRPKGAFMFKERADWDKMYSATHHKDGSLKNRRSFFESKELEEETYHGNDFFEAYEDLWFNEDEMLDEAEYQGRKVPLGKPMRGDVKKFKVYVKKPGGNVVKVNFGDPDMKIKKSNPARRRSFRARHNCDNPGPRTKARYWSCRKW
jgi:hypothetical protein